MSDKTGMVEFARGLASFGVDILSTGGTASKLRDDGVSVVEVSDYTGFPEMFDGRVKTLHHKIHGGLLQRRDNDVDQMNAAKHDIHRIDFVVVNLYPFEQTVAKDDATLEEAIENIDIGGPSMLRSAAKNFRWVTAITDPADYALVLDEMAREGGNTTLATRQYLARKVFKLTGRYDTAIANYLFERELAEEAKPKT